MVRAKVRTEQNEILVGEVYQGVQLHSQLHRMGLESYLRFLLQCAVMTLEIVLLLKTTESLHNGSPF